MQPKQFRFYVIILFVNPIFVFFLAENGRQLVFAELIEEVSLCDALVPFNPFLLHHFLVDEPFSKCAYEPLILVIHDPSVLVDN